MLGAAATTSDAGHGIEAIASSGRRILVHPIQRDA